MPDAVETSTVAQSSSSSLQAWLQQGEQLYAAALDEYRQLEAQLGELEARLADKQAEVNQIAEKLGKPSLDGVPAARRPASTELVPAAVVEELQPSRASTSNSNANIARALTGRFGR
jgi:molecular chaperone GrpE (heat shock protein)